MLFPSLYAPENLFTNVSSTQTVLRLVMLTAFVQFPEFSFQGYALTPMQSLPSVQDGDFALVL